MTRQLAGCRVLITGGLGFIGSNTAHRLVSAGAEVTLIDNLLKGHGGNRFNIHDIERAVEVELLDIRNTDALRKHIRSADLLLNMAGQTSHWGSMEDPRNDLEINVVAQGSLLENCRIENPDIRVLYLSTRQVYGRPDYVPVDEDHPVKPVDVNGIGKHAAEDLHLLYHRIYGLRTVVLRISNTYGPRMRVKDAQQMFLGIWIRCLLQGDPIAVYGDGTQIRDLLHVSDCVDAVVHAATSDKAVGQIYNVGSTEGIQLSHLASRLASLEPGGTWNLVPFPAQRELIDIGSYTADTRKIENDLGWRPLVHIAAGLSETVEFYRRFGEHYWAVET